MKFYFWKNYSLEARAEMESIADFEKAQQIANQKIEGIIKDLNIQ